FSNFILEINKKRIKNMKSVCEYFEMVNISLDDQDKIMKEYSTGMKSKMQTLVNIISDKKVLLLDEPFTSLDILVQEQMKKLLREIKKNKIIVITTHILEIAIELCDEIIILKDGKFNLIEKKDLNDNEYKKKIIQSLECENVN
ncbi:ABC transporter, ATP-binding protein, partial [human gut metagenome]